MKRKVIFGALAALFLGGGIFTAVNLTQKEQVSDLTLDNIEAMTECEIRGIIGGVKYNCEGERGSCAKSSHGHTLTCSGTQTVDRF